MDRVTDPTILATTLPILWLTTLFGISGSQEPVTGLRGQSPIEARLIFLFRGLAWVPNASDPTLGPSHTKLVRQVRNVKWNAQALVI